MRLGPQWTRERLGTMVALLGLSVVSAMPLEAQQAPPEEPAVEVTSLPAVDPMVHPFRLKSATIELGNVKPSTTAEVTFELFNASQRPVPVTRITTTCSCMANDDDLPRIVRSGERTEFSVTFKGRPNTGLVQERVTVWYQTPQGTEKAIGIPIKGEIAFPVKADPFFVNLLLEDRTGTIDLQSSDGVYFKVLSAGGKPPVFLKGTRDGSKIAWDRHIIMYDFTDVPDEQLGNFFLIQTTHPDSPLIDLRIIHKGLIRQGRLQGQWAVSQDRFPLGRMSDGQTADITVTVVGIPEGDGMPELHTSNPMLEAEIVEERIAEKRGRVFAIRFTMHGDKEALLEETMTMEMGGQSKVFDIFVWANPSE